MPTKPSYASLFALALATASTLALQVALTRLFSAALAYHFSFLAISLAMLGTGGGALLLYLRPAWFGGSPERQLARWCAVLAILLILLPLVLVRLDLSGVNELDLHFGINLLLASGVSALPSVAAGVVVALAIARYAHAIGVVYAFDLLGAGLGALLIVPAMWVVDAPTLIVMLGLLAALAAWLFAREDGKARSERRWAVLFAALALLVVGLGKSSSLLFLDPRIGPLWTGLLADRWTPIARVIAASSGRPFIGLFYDRVWAPIPLPEAGTIPGWKELHTGPASIGYELTGPGRTLIIGGGGGRDIWTALSAGQTPVDVIELSEGNRKVVDEDLASQSGAPYSYRGVNTVIGDGRSVLSARDTLYDSIHIGFTDTLSASAAQGYALTENNLYTVEAYLEYFRHLKPDGILNVSRALKLVGDEALRATVLAMAGLQALGVPDPRRHVIVVLGRDVLGPPTGTVLARKRPFTPEETARARELAQERAGGILYAPGGPYHEAWEALAHAPDLQSFCNSYPLNVCPPTDDRPFFFSMRRLSMLGERMSGYLYVADPVLVLLLTLVILGILSALALVLPMILVRGEGTPTLGSLSYFAAIGLGFLLLEMSLIQRLVLFLGYPTYALSVVLFSLLVFSGLGSAWTSRFVDHRRALTLSLVFVIVLSVATAFGLQPLLRELIVLPFGVRVLVSITLIFPLALVLGMAMPIGLSRLSALAPSGTPYAWGVNGIMSVLASVLGIAIAIHLGFTLTTLAGAACYLFALLHVWLGSWAGEAATRGD